MKAVVMQTWDESERGWGIRPDGCSLHRTNEDVKQFIKEYWDSMPDEVPDEYSRPGGDAKIIDVDDELYEKVAKSKNGIRIWQSDMRKLNLK